MDTHSEETADGLRVVRAQTGHRLEGRGPVTEGTNSFLAHLETRGFAPGTVQGYAFDLLNFSRFLAERNAYLGDVVPTDLFDYLGWQQQQRATRRNVVRIADRRGLAPATMTGASPQCATCSSTR